MSYKAYILAIFLSFISCSKMETLPENKLILEFENQHYEFDVVRTTTIYAGKDLILNTYTFSIDSVRYLNTDYFVWIDLALLVNCNSDSVAYSDRYSELFLTYINKVDSNRLYFSSNICNPSNFEFVLDKLELMNQETGYYSGKFSGTLCDSTNNFRIGNIKGELIRALL